MINNYSIMQSSFLRYPLFAVSITMAAPTVAMAEEASRADKIRGSYENKIRFFAPPEKIFETFASKKKDDKLVMTYNDIFRALTPYNFTSIKDTNSYFENFTPRCIKLVDPN